jgi:hypothetical protein
MYSNSRLALTVLMLTFLFACKKKSDDEIKWDNSPVVSGKVYGKAFKMETGRAKTDVYNNKESVVVNLSRNAAFNCASPEQGSYQVYFRAPKKVGIYTAESRDIWLGFDDPETDRSVGFVSVDCKVEISSINNGRVVGRISFADQPSASDVTGTFNVPLCP